MILCVIVGSEKPDRSMLKNIDLTREVPKADYKTLKGEADLKLAALQRQCKALGIPIIVVFEGWSAAGKGTLINEMILPLDPRGFSVYSIAIRPRKRRFTLSCGDSGSGRRPAVGWLFSTGVGIAGRSRTGLRVSSKGNDSGRHLRTYARSSGS